MTFHTQTDFTIPKETIRVAHAAYPHGSTRILMRDALGTIYPRDAQRAKLKQRGTKKIVKDAAW